MNGFDFSPEGSEGATQSEDYGDLLGEELDRQNSDNISFQFPLPNDKSRLT